MKQLLKRNQGEMFDDQDDIHNENMKRLIAKGPACPHTHFNAEDHDLHQYDLHIVAISTGKDCLAVLCKLLEGGIHPSKIIALHHLVDGEPTNPVFFDWHYVDDYFDKLCHRLGIRKGYAYLSGGIRDELYKKDRVSNDIVVVKPDGGLVQRNRPRAKPNTRMMFPQVVADLKTRWCSSILKIEPGEKFVREMDTELLGKKVAFHTGERRQESTGRSKYNQLECHRTDTARGKNPRVNRYVDHYRLVLNFSEEQVWETLQNFEYITPDGEYIQGILPPPAYALFPRSSCALCIFNNDSAYATLLELDPERVAKVAAMEDEFKVTIARPDRKTGVGRNVLERAKSARPFPYWDEEAVKQCFESAYKLPIFTSDGGRDWQVPFGAFKEGCGAI